jgi:hypothetical protein
MRQKVSMEVLLDEDREELEQDEGPLKHYLSTDERETLEETPGEHSIGNTPVTNYTFDMTQGQDSSPRSTLGHTEHYQTKRARERWETTEAEAPYLPLDSDGRTNSARENFTKNKGKAPYLPIPASPPPPTPDIAPDGRE